MVEKSTKKSHFEHFLAQKFKKWRISRGEKRDFWRENSKMRLFKHFFKHSVYFLESVTLVEFLRLMIEY